jgi:acetamidase/formamidase
MGLVRGLTDEPIAKICAIADGLVQFDVLRIPFRPMVGVIAVAPAGEAMATAMSAATAAIATATG